METILDNQVKVIQNSIDLFKSAPEILKSNQQRTQKALTVGNSILEQWQQAWSIQDEGERLQALAIVDERSRNYMVNISTALKEQKELRVAITQMMDEFKKMFTAAENDIDKTKADTVPAKVQDHRNAFATEILKIQERKRKEAEDTANKAKEAIDIKTDAEKDIAASFNDWLLQAKNKLVNAFNTITINDFDVRAEKLKAYTPVFGFEFTPRVGSYGTKYHSKEDIIVFYEAEFLSAKQGFENTTTAELSLLRDELIEKLPSKKAELIEQKRLADEAEAAKIKAEKEEAERQAAIAKANAAEKEKLEKEAAVAREKAAIEAAKLKAQQEAAAAAQKQREEAEAAKLATEAEDAKRKAEQEADIKKQGEQTMVMFEQEAAVAEATSVSAKEGYEIEILHPVAYTQIFALWFEQDGKNLPVNKIGNTKLDQMKSWAEKYAVKTGTKIDSKFLKYNKNVTAINKK